VERWGDLSGNGNDATQGTGSRQPIKEDLVSYDGGTEQKLTSPFASNESEKSLTVLALVDLNNVIDTQVIVQGGRTLIVVRDGSIRCNIGGSSGQCQTPVTTTPTLSLSRWDLSAGESQIWQDGALKDFTTTSPDRSTSQTGIGNIGSNNLSPYGDIGSVMITDAALSEGEIDKAFGHLAHKAARNGIPEPLQNLPADHPYKSSPPTV